MIYNGKVKFELSIFTFYSACHIHSSTIILKAQDKNDSSDLDGYCTDL